MKPCLLLVPILALVACSQAPAPERDLAPTPAATGRVDAARAPSVAAPPTPGSAAPSDRRVPAASTAPRAGVDGYGDLRFGMDEAEARAAFGAVLKGDAVQADNCAYLRPAVDDEFRIGFMFEAGRFVRYDVDIAEETAPGGGRVGQSRADIERLYAGRVQVQPHEYVAGGKYLRIGDAGIANGALVFETDPTGRVTRWRVGRTPQVDYVEGCS